MKIGILTHYDVNNQGAQLQLYATYMQLKELGHEPIVLTYKKNYDFDLQQERRNQITLASIPYILKHFLWEKGFGLTWHNVKKYLYNRQFRNRVFRMGYYSLTEMDAAIVGADEVFSLEIGVNMMMYGHAVHTDNMIAYAPSIGQTDMRRIEAFHCKELMSSGLRRFKSLSARDHHTQQIVEDLTGIKPVIVCDPVLLYKFPLERFSFPKGTPSKDYMVVYSYDARFISKSEIEAISKYAKENNLLTVSVGTYHKWCDVNIACDALRWLKCIQGAKAIVTDTFHGTIASVITHCPMALYYSETVNSNKMLDLIDRLGLHNRKLNEVTYHELKRVFKEPVDMADLDSRVDKFRSESFQYLKFALENLSL